MSIVAKGEEGRNGEKNSICGKVTKGIAKRVEESQERKSSICGQAMRNTAKRMEKEFSVCLTTESTGVL